MAAALLPFAVVHTARPIWSTVIAIDASEEAGAAVYTKVSAEEAQNLVEHAVFVKKPQGRQQIPLVKRSFHDQHITNFVQERAWTTAFFHKWRRAEHINYLETRAAVLATEWAVSHHIVNHIVIILSDSTAPLGALTKGRSSSPGMLLPCRKLGALCVAHNIQLMFLHVRSEHNPADEPSRPSGRPGYANQSST